MAGGNFGAGFTPLVLIKVSALSQSVACLGGQLCELHPGSAELNLRLVNRLLRFVLALVTAAPIYLANAGPAPTNSASRFKVLTLAESGGHHIAFTRAARPWLKKCGDENGFEVDYLDNTEPLSETFLAKY